MSTKHISEKQRVISIFVFGIVIGCYYRFHFYCQKGENFDFIVMIHEHDRLNTFVFQHGHNYRQSKVMC